MDDKNTILCRCEDLTREDILKCIQDGYRTIDEIKRVTRAGMGPCQGTYLPDVDRTGTLFLL